MICVIEIHWLKEHLSKQLTSSPDMITWEFTLLDMIKSAFSLVLFFSFFFFFYSQQIKVLNYSRRLIEAQVRGKWITPDCWCFKSFIQSLRDKEMISNKTFHNPIVLYLLSKAPCQPLIWLH